MIRKLTEKDRRAVIDFAYRREKENLFVLGSFQRYKKPFAANYLAGAFRGKNLTGLAIFFKVYESFVVNSYHKNDIADLVDHVVKAGAKIMHVPCFKKYGDAIIRRLTKHHFKPKCVRDSLVFILDKKDFHDFSDRPAAVAKRSDVGELATIHFPGKPRSWGKRIDYKNTFVYRRDGKIISTANVHGASKNYFQIGGVHTLEKYRNQGFAKKVISGLCRHYFRKGKKYALLFMDKNNKPANKVYRKIGFKPKDKFVLAEY